jgi:sRNA-binding protein
MLELLEGPSVCSSFKNRCNNAIEKNLLLKLYFIWTIIDCNAVKNYTSSISDNRTLDFMVEPKFRLTEAEKKALDIEIENGNGRKSIKAMELAKPEIQDVSIKFGVDVFDGSSVSSGELEILARMASFFKAAQIPNPRIEALEEAQDFWAIRDQFDAVATNETSSVIRRTFAYYVREFRDSEEKVKKENALIPKDLLTGSSEIAKSAIDSNQYLLWKIGEIRKTLHALVAKLSGLPTNLTLESWAARFLLQCRMMTPRKKDNHCTCVFPDGSKLRFYQTEEFTQLRELSTQLLLCFSLLTKNKSIIAIQKKIEDLQKKFVKTLSKSNTLPPQEYLSAVAQVRSPWLALSRELEAQKSIYDEKGGYGTGSSLQELSQFTRGEILAFETITGRRLTLQQTDLLKSLFAGKINAFQLAMAAGKSSMLAPFLAYYITLIGKTPVITPHISQMESVAGSLGVEFPRSFGRPIVQLNFSRKSCRSIGFLRRIWGELCDAHLRGFPIIIGANDIAKLQLSYIELLLGECAHGKRTASLFKLQRDILVFFKRYCIGLTDEVHLVLKTMEEVNFPIGRSLPIRQTIIDGTMLLAKAIAAISRPNKTSLFDLATNTQDRLSIEQTLEDFKLLGQQLLKTKIGMENEDPTIEEWLRNHGIAGDIFVQCISGQFPKENGKQDPVTELILGAMRQDDFPEQRDAYERMAVVFGTCTTLFPSMLHKTANHGYGFRINTFKQIDNLTYREVKAGKLTIVPYLGAGIPSANDFASEEVKVCALLQLSLCKDSSIFLVGKNGSDQLVRLFFDSYRNVIELEKANLAKNPRAECPVDSLFRRVFGSRWGYSDIEDVFAICKEYGEDKCLKYSQMLDSMREYLLQSDSSRLLLFEKALPTLLSFRPGRITSTAIDRSRYFSKSIAFTGTPNSEETWTPDLRGPHLRFEGAVEGHILFKFFKDLENQRSTFTNITATKFGVESVLENGLQNKDQKTNFRVLLDPSGLFKLFNNEEVARKILLWTNREKIELQAVVYFHKFDDRDGGEFRILRPYDRSAIALDENTPLETKGIPNLKPETLKINGLDPDSCGYFLDQLHAAGIDPVLPSTASGVLVSDLFNATMSNTTQAIMRLRQFLLAQTVSMVILADKDEKIEPNDAFLAFVRNQGESLRQQILKSLRNRIDNALKDLVLEHLPELRNEEDTDSLHKARNTFSLFEDFFVSSTSDDPLLNYVTHSENVPGHTIVKNFYDVKIKYFKDCCRKIENETLRKQFVDALKKLTKNKGFFAQLLDDANTLLDGENFQSASALHSADAEMDNDRDAETEAQVQMERQAEQQVERQIEKERLMMNLEIPQSESSFDHEPRDEKDLNPTYISTSENVECMETFPTIAVRDGRNGMAGISVDSTARVAIKNYGQLMPPWLRISENQRFASIDEDTPLLSPQCELPSFFLISKPKNGGEHSTVVIITTNEAAILRNAKQDENQNFAVYGMEGVFFGGRNNFSPEEIADARCYIHIYYGDYRSLANIASQEWIEGNICLPNEGIFSDAEVAFLRWFHLCAKLRGEPIEKAHEFIAQNFQRFSDADTEKYILREMEQMGMPIKNPAIPRLKIPTTPPQLVQSKAKMLRSVSTNGESNGGEDLQKILNSGPSESIVKNAGEPPSSKVSTIHTEVEEREQVSNPADTTSVKKIENVEVKDGLAERPTVENEVLQQPNLHPDGLPINSNTGKAEDDLVESRTMEKEKSSIPPNNQKSVAETQTFTIKTWQKITIGAACVLLGTAIALCFWPISVLYALGPSLYYLIIFSPAMAASLTAIISIASCKIMQIKRGAVENI